MGLRGPEVNNQDNYTLKNTRWPHALSLVQPGTRAGGEIPNRFRGYNTQ